jgi:hypothetical protein
MELGMTKRLTLIFLAAVSGIGSAAAAERAPRETFVRLQNDTSAAFEHVRASYPEPVSYDRIGPGEASPWQRVARAYGYSYLEVFVDGERLVMQPNDFMGTNLGPGRVTYHVTIDDGRRLMIRPARER